MKKDTIKKVKAAARQGIVIPPNKKHKDKSKYTRKVKHKKTIILADKGIH